jgi:predicted amidohydrolase YtcJ
MDPQRPLASAVAVCDGKILSIGESQEIQEQMISYNRGIKYNINRTFEDKIILPGFIEAHMHTQMEGLFWQHVYIGYYDRVTPAGTLSEGCKTKQEIIKKLTESVKTLNDDESALIGWGYDPSLLNKNQFLTADDLDMVSKTRPVFVFNASGHIYYVNRFLLKLADIDSSTNIEGVIKDVRGNPTGELQELAAAGLVFSHLSKSFGSKAKIIEATLDAATIAQRVGCTTITDWAFGEIPNGLEAYKLLAFKDAANHQFPVRVVLAPLDIYLMEQGKTTEGAIRFLAELVNDTIVTKEDTASSAPVTASSVAGAIPDRLFIGPIKTIVDGSIQGFTASLKWPGYFNGHKNGIVNRSLAELKNTLLPFHRAGFRLTFHTNGDQAVDIALDTIEYLLTKSPRLDHRHSLEHAQIISNSQFKRIAAMKINLNIFSGHIYYWGDFHLTQTLGPDRANHMDATASAKRYGIHFSLHSDSPVTPVNPLFSAWCAVNRLTESGRVLGENEKISVEDALRAITIEAAYLLHKDDIIGSIEVGKHADFTILEEDPLSVGKERLKDIRIWGTVLGGTLFPTQI